MPDWYCSTLECRAFGVKVTANAAANCPSCRVQQLGWRQLPPPAQNSVLAPQVASRVMHAFPHIDDYTVFVDQQDAYQPQNAAVNIGTLFTHQGQGALNNGTVASLVARQKFFLGLAVHLTRAGPQSAIRQHRQTGWNEPLTLRQFLGSSTLVSLYKAAISEENKSANYRWAVVLEGAKSFAHHGWGGQQQHIIVSGPSASGKSYGAQRVIQQLIADGYAGPPVMINPQQTWFVSVDGGDGRAASQVRKIVIQCAVALGFRGIEDLHSQTELKVKGVIKSAALASPQLVHIIEPLTFADPSEYFSFTPTENTIFATVFTPRQDVLRLGESRAWYDNRLPVPPPNEIEINRRKPGCESKAYSDHYTAGAVMSAKALEVYHEKTRRRLYVTVTNTLHFNQHDQIDAHRSVSVVKAVQLTTRHNENGQGPRPWVSDNTAASCSSPRCTRTFGVTQRRHHCRLCGQIFCSACVPERTKVGLPKVLMCGPCFAQC